MNVADVFSKDAYLDGVSLPDLGHVVSVCRHFLADDIAAGGLEDVLLREIREAGRGAR